VQSHCRIMAEHLASIFGTEKDRVNCPFYFKIGACRHGDRCSRMHNRPTISPTLLFSNMYQRPDMAISGTDPHAQNMDPRKLQEHFEVTFVFLHNSCFFLITVMRN
jgi:splicing factor U2AF subunit